MRNKNKKGFLFILNHPKRLYNETELSAPRIFITIADNALTATL
jgi:hypothetical protein